MSERQVTYEILQELKKLRKLMEEAQKPETAFKQVLAIQELGVEYQKEMKAKALEKKLMDNMEE